MGMLLGNKQMMKNSSGGLPVDVGGLGTSNSSFIPTYTFISLLNPANNTGTLTEVQLYVNRAMAGLKIATFRFDTGPGNRYTCKSSVAIGALSVGYHSITGLSLGITSGDFIGCYYTSGKIEGATYVSGIVYVSGDRTAVGDSPNYNTSNQDIRLAGLG